MKKTTKKIESQIKEFDKKSKQVKKAISENKDKKQLEALVSNLKQMGFMIISMLPLLILPFSRRIIQRNRNNVTRANASARHYNNLLQEAKSVQERAKKYGIELGKYASEADFIIALEQKRKQEEQNSKKIINNIKTNVKEAIGNADFIQTLVNDPIARDYFGLDIDPVTTKEKEIAEAHGKALREKYNKEKLKKANLKARQFKEYNNQFNGIKDHICKRVDSLRFSDEEQENTIKEIEKDVKNLENIKNIKDPKQKKAIERVIKSSKKATDSSKKRISAKTKIMLIRIALALIPTTVIMFPDIINIVNGIREGRRINKNVQQAYKQGMGNILDPLYQERSLAELAHISNEHERKEAEKKEKQNQFIKNTLKNITNNFKKLSNQIKTNTVNKSRNNSVSNNDPGDFTGQFGGLDIDDGYAVLTHKKMPWVK